MKHKTLLSILALVALVAFSLSAFAQDDPREQERYKNGLLPTGTYGGSSVTVNLLCGAPHNKFNAESIFMRRRPIESRGIPVMPPS